MLSQGSQGRRRGYIPHYESAGLSEAGKGYIEKPAAVRKGSGKAAAMALRAACSGIEIQDSKQTKHHIVVCPIASSLRDNLFLSLI